MAVISRCLADPVQAAPLQSFDQGNHTPTGCYIREEGNMLHEGHMGLYSLIAYESFRTYLLNPLSLEAKQAIRFMGLGFRVMSIPSMHIDSLGWGLRFGAKVGLQRYRL